MPMQTVQSKRKVNANSYVQRKACSLFMISIIFLASFITVFVVVPITVKAGGSGPSSPSPLTLNITSVSSITDTFFSQLYFNRNYGSDAWLIVDSKTGYRNRFVIKFNLASLPSGCSVVDAELGVYYLDYDHDYEDPDGRLRDCWELDRSWDEGTGTRASPDTSDGATWRYYDHGIDGQWDAYPDNPVQDYRDTDDPPNGDWGDDMIDQVEIGDTQEWHRWNVASSVQAFSDSTRTNCGWIIDDHQEGTGDYYITRYASSEYSIDTSLRPFLNIEYYLSPQTATEDPTVVDSTSATLQGNVTFAGGSCVYAGFNYGKTTGSTTGNGTAAGAYINGSSFTKSVTLNPGTKYYYKSWVKNPSFFTRASNERQLLTEPGSLTGFTATTHNTTQINLAWTNGVNGTGAYIEYRLNPMGEWVPVNATGYITGTSFNHGSLSSGQTYYYRAKSYASDGGWKSSGNTSAPFGSSSDDSATTEDAGGGSWIGISGINLYSSVGGTGLSEALNGTSSWVDTPDRTHWFILDLGRNYTLYKFRGRSATLDDPTVVDIYVSTSDNEGEWGAAVANISTWDTTATWVEVDSTDKIGRYIKVEVEDTEDGHDALNWGGSLGSYFQIIDAYGIVKLEDETYYFNTYDSGGGDGTAWATKPEVMVDNNENKYAMTTIRDDYEALTGNSCAGTDLGTISTVKIRAKGYYNGGLGGTIVLTPKFGGAHGTSGDPQNFGCGSSAAWSSWYDITNDTDGPIEEGGWDWDDVDDLCCGVTVGSIDRDSTLLCSKVEIKVDYIPPEMNTPPVAAFEGPGGTVNHGTIVTFNASDSSDPDNDGYITNYSWDKDNDGTVDGYGEEISFTYLLANEYTAKLTVTDNRGGTSCTTDTFNVSQNIEVYYNEVNNGDNYITWGMEQTTAVMLAKELRLAQGDIISKFDPTQIPRSSWRPYHFVVGEGEDFEIDTWDALLIRVAETKSHSFAPESHIDGDTHSLVMDSFAVNEGWDIISWTKDYTTTAEEFIASMVSQGEIDDEENLEINVYDSNNDTWSNYNPSIDPVFQENFIIYPYDQIFFRVPSGHDTITYDASAFTQ